jgi:hypothetical protein
MTCVVSAADLLLLLLLLLLLPPPLQAFMTNTWACAERIPNDTSVCVDSWTGVQVGRNLVD